MTVPPRCPLLASLLSQAPQSRSGTPGDAFRKHLPGLRAPKPDCPRKQTVLVKQTITLGRGGGMRLSSVGQDGAELLHQHLSTSNQVEGMHRRGTRAWARHVRGVAYGCHHLAGNRTRRGGGRAGARLETQSLWALPRAWKAAPQKGTGPGQGWQDADGKRTPPSLLTRGSWKVPLGTTARAPTPHSLTSGGQMPLVTEASPPREGPPLTFASVSTTLTSGCLAGYFAMSHSKWVTKDVRSTGRNTCQQVSGTPHLRRPRLPNPKPSIH